MNLLLSKNYIKDHETFKSEMILLKIKSKKLDLNRKRKQINSNLILDESCDETEQLNTIHCAENDGNIDSTRGFRGNKGIRGIRGLPGNFSKDAQIFYETYILNLPTFINNQKLYIEIPNIGKVHRKSFLDLFKKVPKGPEGLPGLPGNPGIPGKPGLIGKPGKRGINGKDGKHRLNGLKGPQGEIGEPGSIGLLGEKGYRGLKGIIGEPGFRGINGKRGKVLKPCTLNHIDPDSDINSDCCRKVNNKYTQACWEGKPDCIDIYNNAIVTTNSIIPLPLLIETTTSKLIPPKKDDVKITYIPTTLIHSSKISIIPNSHKSKSSICIDENSQDGFSINNFNNCKVKPNIQNIIPNNEYNIYIIPRQNTLIFTDFQSTTKPLNILSVTKPPEKPSSQNICKSNYNYKYTIELIDYCLSKPKELSEIEIDDDLSYVMPDNAKFLTPPPNENSFLTTKLRPFLSRDLNQCKRFELDTIFITTYLHCFNKPIKNQELLIDQDKGFNIAEPDFFIQNFFTEKPDSKDIKLKSYLFICNDLLVYGIDITRSYTCDSLPPEPGGLPGKVHISLMVSENDDINIQSDKSIITKSNLKKGYSENNSFKNKGSLIDLYNKILEITNKKISPNFTDFNISLEEKVFKNITNQYNNETIGFVYSLIYPGANFGILCSFVLLEIFMILYSIYN